MGDRDAAQAARERIQAKLRDLEGRERPIEMRFTLGDGWNLKDEGDVHHTLHDTPLEVPDGTRKELDPDLGEGCGEGLPNGRKQVGTDCFRGGEPECADPDLVLDGGLGFIRKSQDPLCIVQEPFSGSREFQTVPNPIEQRGALVVSGVILVQQRRVALGRTSLVANSDNSSGFHGLPFRQVAQRQDTSHAIS